MSGSFSNWLEVQLLNHVFGGQPYPATPAVYIALYTSVPTIMGGGTEVSGGGYVRMPVTFNPPYGTPPLMSNPDPIQWGSAGTAWGTIVAGGLFDDVTAGNFLGSALLVDPIDGVTPAPKTIGIGDVFRVPTQNLIVGFVTPTTPVPSSMMLGQPTIRRIGSQLVRPL